MDRSLPPRHPKGSRARVLLTSVFGPYARDDEYGSRAHQPDGAVPQPGHAGSGRLLAAHVPPLVGPDDDPGQPRGARRRSSTSPPSSASRRSCGRCRTTSSASARSCRTSGRSRTCARSCESSSRRPRSWSAATSPTGPGSRTSSTPTTSSPGEGIAWFRAFLGEDAGAPVRHPLLLSAFGARTMGVPFGTGPGETAATLVPSVGCPLGCNFCSTSAMFGGKGRSVSFYEDGDSLFEVMLGIEKGLGVRAFFVMDENFLLHRKRALRLLALMQEHGKSWALYVFSSANALRQYTDEELVGLGVSWVWLGLEGKASAYAKLNGTDTLGLVSRLQSLGIRVLGLEHRRPARARRLDDRRRDRPRGGPRHRVPPVHALHAGARHAALRRARGDEAPCCRATSARTPTPTASCASTTATRGSATARRRSTCCARSGATSRRTARA